MSTSNLAKLPGNVTTSLDLYSAWQWRIVDPLVDSLFYEKIFFMYPLIRLFVCGKTVFV